MTVVCKILCASLTRALLPYVYLLFIMSAACVLENGEIIFFLECFFLFPCALFDHLSNIMKQAGRQVSKKRKKKILAYSYFYFSFFSTFIFHSLLLVLFETIRFFYVERKKKKIFRPKHNICCS